MAQETPPPTHPPAPSRHEGVPFGAIVLILLGIVFLLQTTGVLPWEAWLDLWRFWPVLIIAGGLSILLGGRASWAALLVVLLLVAVGASALWFSSDQEEVVTSFVEPLGDLQSVAVRVAFGAGDLRLRSLAADSPNLVQAEFQTPGLAANAALRRSGESGELRITMAERGRFGRPAAADWDVALSRSPRLAIDIDGGAANIRLNLRDLRVAELDLDIGAADVEVTLPANAGETTVSVDAGAADIEISVPEGVAAKIDAARGLSSLEVDTSRFPRTDGGYASPNFASAQNRVTIDLRVGVSSVKVR